MKKFVLLVISASLLVSCNIDELEFDNVEVQPINGVFSFPLGQSTYVLRDLILKQTGDSISFQEDSTSLLTLLYYDTITYAAQDDFVQIDDIVESNTVTVIPPFVGPTPPGNPVMFSESFSAPYDPVDGEQLDSIFYENGDLTIVTTSGLAAGIVMDYTFTIANTINIGTGNPVSLSGSITGSNNETLSQSLVNHKTLLTDASGDNRFDILLSMEVTLDPGENLTGAESISFELTYGNQTFNLIYGKFGRDTVQVGDQSIELDFFSQAAREGITFGNPSLTFDFRNSFGIPVAVDFSGLNGDDGNGGNQIFLTGQVVNSPPIVAGSGINTPAPGTPGETVQTIVEIDRSNSNLGNILASAPDRLVFNVAGISNPNDLTAENYVQPTSQITAYVAMEVPMEIQLENYQESGRFSLGDGIDLDNVDSAFVRVVTLNELPFSGIATLDIQAADSSSLYLITDNLVINAPFININGEVTDPNGATVDIPLPPEAVEALANASHIAITLTLNTPASQTSREIYVKVLADYELLLKVGIGGKFNLEW
ncbi:MAG: hypothetical protein RLN88_04990 [Ekhidna sp.]|uniref:hypothetical protein n=1 Tax=Ekhidna sp. TaxID=2608089 RepID=UPI0032EC8AE0